MSDRQTSSSTTTKIKEKLRSALAEFKPSASSHRLDVTTSKIFDIFDRYGYRSKNHKSSSNLSKSNSSSTAQNPPKNSSVKPKEHKMKNIPPKKSAKNSNVGKKRAVRNELANLADTAEFVAATPLRLKRKSRPPEFFDPLKIDCGRSLRSRSRGLQANSCTATNSIKTVKKTTVFKVSRQTNSSWLTKYCNQQTTTETQSTFVSRQINNDIQTIRNSITRTSQMMLVASNGPRISSAESPVQPNDDNETATSSRPTANLSLVSAQPNFCYKGNKIYHVPLMQVKLEPNAEF